MTELAVLFDTHKFVKQLVSTGFTEEQAESQVHLLSEILDNQLSSKADLAKVDSHVLELKRDIATVEAHVAELKVELKRDIATVEANLRKDMGTIEANLRKDMGTIEANLRKDMGIIESNLRRDLALIESNLKQNIEAAKVETLKWTTGMFAAQTALIIGAMFAMLKMNQPSFQPTGYRPPPSQEMHIPSPALPSQPVPFQSR